ncbi:MAG TPA: Ku protein [Patescibacteria group bacterium]|nr:Ku protein [Patescibacteria group bacterium]
MKAVWQGSIAFGLVDIPVKLYSATEPRAISFKLFCNKCKSPLQYKRFCVKCKEEVPWSDVIYGFEISKGKYKFLTREKIEELKPEKTNTAEVLTFVDISSIDPIYFQKSYYVIPAKNKEKAFFLFLDALRASARAAVVKFVMRNKEYVCVVRYYRNILLMTTLLYLDEIRKLERFEELKDRPEISSEELKLAGKIIEKYSSKSLDMEKYHDEFAEKVKALIQGKKVKETKRKEPKPEKLIEALRLSVKK